MSDHRDDREIEDLLRAALHERAEQVVPAGDGLRQIQARTSSRRRLRWFKPTLVALTAAAAAAAVAVLPNVIKTADDKPEGVAQGTLSSRTPDTKMSTTQPPATDGPETNRLQPKALAWPYPDEQTAMKEGLRAGAYLKDPSETAQTFIRAAITSMPLTPGKAVVGADSTVVPLSRNGVEVTRVTLAKVVASGNTTIYVVERADSKQLAITQVPNLHTLKPPTAGGTVAATEPDSNTVVALVEAGGTDRLYQQSVSSKAKIWSVAFEPLQVNGAVVAWTQGKKGLSAIAAAPTGR